LRAGSIGRPQTARLIVGVDGGEKARLPRDLGCLPRLPGSPADPAFDCRAHAARLGYRPADVLVVRVGGMQLPIEGHAQERATRAAALTHSFNPSLASVPLPLDNDTSQPVAVVRLVALDPDHYCAVLSLFWWGTATELVRRPNYTIQRGWLPCLFDAAPFTGTIHGGVPMTWRERAR
jgi:hypothetical protein